MTTDQTLQARIRTLRFEAEGIMSVELVPLSGAQWPAFTAGAHIDLHLPNGLTRSYSLLNSQSESNRYVLGILADGKSRGGSRYVHDHFRCGHSITIGLPRNAFALDETTKDIVLIAGGIGITPILSMYRRLLALNGATRHADGTAGRDADDIAASDAATAAASPKRVKLVYCARRRDAAAFIEELEALSRDIHCDISSDISSDIHYHFDTEHDGKPFDLSAFMAQQSPDVDAYCCGPSVMLDAFEAACASAGVTRVHVERFAADTTLTQAPRVGYQVQLAKSGLTLDVNPDTSLLDTVLAAGVDVDHSCMEGICGACETAVLSGCPDHRDSVLSKAEKASNKVIMLCVSGAKQGPLVLDL